MKKIQIHKLDVGSLETCCYIISNSENECAVIDPGGDADKISEKIKSLKLSLKYILITHSHFDHIEGLEKLKDLYNDVQIVCHKTCGERMQSPQLNLGNMLGVKIKTPPPDRTICDGDIITLGDVSIKSIFLPGHAPGHMVYYIEDENILFSGDTLFNGSLGRTDFEGCSFSDLATGIKEKLLTLSEKTIVYPGHGPETIIKDELKNNPFIKDMM
jgi:glyoxylase-like metal-dependent hydrolase (beta-lactamase superfamily II)